ncbi:hypothetical protein B0T13DRAFT_467353 [Neurospora crassa]|nr:hypothetical protein B0T13DRAFT_467353 [Neurospora crassa]
MASDDTYHGGRFDEATTNSAVCRLTKKEWSHNDCLADAFVVSGRCSFRVNRANLHHFKGVIETSNGMGIRLYST